jgi:hypothetical protein
VFEVPSNSKINESATATSHSQVIAETENDAEAHLSDADDDGEFHLGRIGERDFVLGQLPNLKRFGARRAVDERTRTKQRTGSSPSG